MCPEAAPVISAGPVPAASYAGVFCISRDGHADATLPLPNSRQPLRRNLGVSQCRDSGSPADRKSSMRILRGALTAVLLTAGLGVATAGTAEAATPTCTSWSTY